MVDGKIRGCWAVLTRPTPPNYIISTQIPREPFLWESGVFSQGTAQRCESQGTAQICEPKLL